MTAAVSVSTARSKIGTARILGYGMGDFAFNLTFTFCTLFLQYFYTDVLGIAPAYAGLIIMVALIWEGVTDPLVGYLANNTRTRWGRYRPYVLFGSIPLGLSFLAMFVPTGLQGERLAAYALLAHVVYRTLYTIVGVPFISLSAQMTDDSLERGKLASARMLFGITCGLVLGGVTLPAVAALGGGRIGFFHIGMIYAAVSTAILFACFFSTREVFKPLQTDGLSIATTISAIRKNRPFLLLLGGTVLSSIAYTMTSSGLLYYVKYNGGSETAATIGLTIALTVAALSLWPWLVVTARTSKRIVWLMSATILTIVDIAIFGLRPGPGAILWALLAVSGVGNAGVLTTFWSMLPDTVEVSELKTGQRVEGALFGFVSFSQKVALGLGTGIFGLMLNAVGYVPNHAQSATALSGIVLLYTVVPATLGVGAAVFIFFYSLDRPTHARIVRVIERRRGNNGRSITIV